MLTLVIKSKRKMIVLSKKLKNQKEKEKKETNIKENKKKSPREVVSEK